MHNTLTSLTTRSGIALAAVASALFSSAGLQAGEQAHRSAEKIFVQCQACHAVGPGAAHGVGPSLNGIVGRKIGWIDGFKFSAAMTTAGEAGRIWDEQSLDTLLTDPAAYMPGSPMVGRVSDPQDRAAVIALLKSFSADGSGTQAPTGDPPVSAQILALKGDPEYGEYLASECATCHQSDGSDKGIPSITGWPRGAFVTVMHAYKSKSRENPVMQNIAGALGNDEIAALAAWYAAQKRAGAK